MSKSEKNQKWTQETTTEQSSCSFIILYVFIYTFRCSIIKYLAGLSFVKQSFVQIKYKYKMHHRWICAKGRGDYLQQVHLRIFHSSKHCLASDEQKQKNTGLWTIQVLTGCYSLVGYSSQGRGWNNVRGLLTVKSVSVSFFLILSVYSVFSLPSSTGFTGSGSSSSASFLSLSFTSCTPQ